MQMTFLDSLKERLKQLEREIEAEQVNRRRAEARLQELNAVYRSAREYYDNECSLQGVAAEEKPENTQRPIASMKLKEAALHVLRREGRKMGLGELTQYLKEEGYPFVDAPNKRPIQQVNMSLVNVKEVIREVMKGKKFISVVQ